MNLNVSQLTEWTIKLVNDKITNIAERIHIRIIFGEEILRFSLGNIIEKYKKAAPIILGPTKLMRAKNNFHFGSSSRKTINTLNIQLAEAQENNENEIFTRP